MSHLFTFLADWLKFNDVRAQNLLTYRFLLNFDCSLACEQALIFVVIKDVSRAAKHESLLAG